MPAQWQWQVGVQMRAAVVDLDRRLLRRQSRVQPARRVPGRLAGEPQRRRLRSGVPAANQDPTIRGTSTVPGAEAYTSNLLRPYAGYGNINQHTTEFQDTYHSLQTAVNRRFRNGFSFGAQLYLGHLVDRQHRPQKRLQHNADGSFSLRADQAEYEELNKNLDRRPHYLKANAVWDLPNVPIVVAASSVRSSTTGTSPAS